MPRTLRATSRTVPFAFSVVTVFGFVAMRFSFWLAAARPRRTWPADVAAARALFKVSTPLYTPPRTGDIICAPVSTWGNSSESHLSDALFRGAAVRVRHSCRSADGFFEDQHREPTARAQRLHADGL